MLFFVGLHQPSDAGKFERCMVSVNRLRQRKSDFAVGEWIMDSGAFTSVAKHGGYSETPAEYAAQVNRWARCGTMLAAVSQDYMCEPFVLARTGRSIAEHQQMTVERYDEIKRHVDGAYLMPVLQGYAPDDYVEHVRQYADRLRPGAWVGVGSVCKRNNDPRAIESVLLAIHRERPDLRLHGFGIKLTALGSGLVRHLLHSADSMAWSFAARMAGRDGNAASEARAFSNRVQNSPFQRVLLV